MFHIQKAQNPVKISHPLVRDAYLKKEMGSDKSEHEILVIEARHEETDMEFGSFDTYLYDLLTDLQDLKDQAEKQENKIERVDICTH